MRTDCLKLQTCAFTDRQTERNIHAHVQTDRRLKHKYTCPDRQAGGRTDRKKYIRVKYDNELKFN